jgi:hypothetical protein
MSNDILSKDVAMNTEVDEEEKIPAEPEIAAAPPILPPSLIDNLIDGAKNAFTKEKLPAASSKSPIVKKGGMVKGLVKGVGKGLVGAALGMGADYAADKLKESGHDELGAAADIGSEALSWGGVGATIGSVVPGIGTLAGGAIGAIGGAAYGTYKNWDKAGKWFGANENHSGENLAQMNIEQQHAQATQVPVAMPAAPMTPPATINNFAGSQGSPRNRESYFDRQMMQTFAS